VSCAFLKRVACVCSRSTDCYRKKQHEISENSVSIRRLSNYLHQQNSQKWAKLKFLRRKQLRPCSLQRWLFTEKISAWWRQGSSCISSEQGTVELKQGVAAVSGWAGMGAAAVGQGKEWLGKRGVASMACRLVCLQLKAMQC
jgi:hypothetical protein